MSLLANFIQVYFPEESCHLSDLQSIWQTSNEHDVRRVLSETEWLTPETLRDTRSRGNKTEKNKSRCKHIVAVFIGCSEKLEEDRAHGQLTFNRLLLHVEEELAESHAPRKLKENLAATLPVFLATNYDVVELTGQQTSTHGTVLAKLYVEWWRDFSCGEADFDDGADYCSRECVLQQFEREKDHFDLYIDERANGLWVIERLKSSGYEKDEHQFVSWSKVRGQRALMLGMVLEKLRGTDVLYFSRMASRALKRSNPDEKRSHHAAQQCFSLLNERLHHVFRGVFAPDGTHPKYNREANISYCWIRQSRDQSRFFPKSP